MCASTSSSEARDTAALYDACWLTGAKSTTYAGASRHCGSARAWPLPTDEYTPNQSTRKRRNGRGILSTLAYIICEPCVGTKDTACVDVCPVDCIHPRKDEPQFQSAEMLYIHPDECIDCGACVPACPVEAIFALDETPAKWTNFIAVNAEFFQKARTPSARSWSPRSF